MIDSSSFMRRYKTIIRQPSLPKWKVFEYLVAIELNMLLWEDIVPFMKKSFNLPFDKDYGIDLVAADFSKTAQIKYYNQNSSVTWKSISTYIAYSTKILGIGNMLLVTNNGAKTAKIIRHALPISTYDYDILMNKHIDKKVSIIESMGSLISNIYAP